MLTALIEPVEITG